MARTRTDFIVLHCAATRPIQDIGVTEIRQWHLARGWRDIGYHFVIRRDGELEKGREINEVGAHVANWNSRSIGICLVGGLNDKTFAPEDNFTSAQWATLRKLLPKLLKQFPQATILGHRDFPKVAKACPCFEARAWAKRNGFPAAPMRLS